MKKNLFFAGLFLFLILFVTYKIYSPLFSGLSSYSEFWSDYDLFSWFFVSFISYLLALWAFWGAAKEENEGSGDGVSNTIAGMIFIIPTIITSVATFVATSKNNWLWVFLVMVPVSKTQTFWSKFKKARQAQQIQSTSI